MFGWFMFATADVQEIQDEDKTFRDISKETHTAFTQAQKTPKKKTPNQYIPSIIYENRTFQSLAYKTEKVFKIYQLFIFFQNPDMTLYVLS